MVALVELTVNGLLVGPQVLEKRLAAPKSPINRNMSDYLRILRNRVTYVDEFSVVNVTRGYFRQRQRRVELARPLSIHATLIKTRTENPGRPRG